MAEKNVVKAKKPRAKKGATGYNLMQSVVPPGTILEDLAKEKWIIGPPIGQGGFGVIYSAKKAEEKTANYRYVIKFEPHENGPLFVERNFYLKIAQKPDIDSWVKANKLSHLGLPRYWGSGSHEVGALKYRFLVTDRFGTDLWTMFLENDRRFPLQAVLRVALQTLNVLEYIHSTGYTHGDIKAANLVLGMDTATKNNVYLIDFGLVTRAVVADKYVANPKMAHNGSIEYVSSDAHDGVPTFRGDLECLGLNVLHWLASTLPWEKVATSTTKGKEVQVQQLKKQFMSNLPASLQTLDLDKPSQDILSKYLTYVASIKHNEKPNYKVVRAMLQQALKDAKGSEKGPLEFSKPTASKASPKKSSRAAPEAAKPKRAATKGRAKRDEPSPAESSEEDMEVDEAPKRKVATKARAGKKTVPLTLDSSDEEVDEAPKRKVATKARAGKKTVPLVAIDSSDEEVEEAPRRKVASKARAGKKVVPPTASDTSEEDMEVDEPYTNGKAKRAATKGPRAATTTPTSSAESEEADEEPAPSKKKRGGKKAQEPTVPLWKQSQTAQASGVVRPGEYERQQPAGKSGRSGKKAPK